MSRHKIALLAIVIASLAWSSAGVVTKVLLRTFDPFTLAFIRFLIASGIILPFFLSQKNLHTDSLIKEVVPITLLATANILLFYMGIAKTTVNASSLIYAGEPFLIAVAAYVLLKERVTKQKLLGIIIGFIGVLTILLLPLVEKGAVVSGNLNGNVYIACAAVSFALYTVGSRHLMDRKNYSALTITSISFFVATGIFGILSLTQPHNDLVRQLVHIPTFSLLLFNATVVSIVPYLCYQWAIQYSSPVVASFNAYLQPVFSIILAMIFLGETLTGGFIIGSICVFIGLGFATGTQISEYITKFLKK
jgi:drug/metabolite transporter (DMT)-like permease